MTASFRRTDKFYMDIKSLQEKEKSEWLEDNINSVKWIWAKTYAKIAPHYYIRKHEQPYLYGILQRMIESHGQDELYTNHKGTTYPCRYFYHGKYKYWEMSPVINRAEVSNG